MGSEEELTAKVHAALAAAGPIREIRMFGGIGFMLNGNMAAASSKRGLLVRVGPERQNDALEFPGASQMVMRGRKIEGYIRLGATSANDRTVKALLRMAIAFVQKLPPGASRKKKKRAQRQAG
jgi:TfoX/Sxy family transcriptional regulator of competence genes